MLGKSVIAEKQEEKYLGDILSSEGLAKSVQCTVKDREGKVKGSIYELRAIIENFRMQSVGGIEAALGPGPVQELRGALRNPGPVRSGPPPGAAVLPPPGH